ncbi:hypothetical protein M3Y94_01134700 [Aphelenchoides besseyi]|nr:hypothetical protein M3Y94_01134700 [Aphelenchoides besseyi]
MKCFLIHKNELSTINIEKTSFMDHHQKRRKIRESICIHFSRNVIAGLEMIKIHSLLFIAICSTNSLRRSFRTSTRTKNLCTFRLLAPQSAITIKWLDPSTIIGLLFSTLRSFAWLDRYDLRQADDRYTLKAMEKENKKLRDAGRKQRNDEIRNLASYVRRRDPRVRLHREQLEERKQAEFNRVEMQRRKQIQNNLLKFQDQQMPSTLSEDHLDALEKIENDLDEQFGVLACSDDEEDSDNFFCIVCEKKFKNAKSFANHERSKKHKDAVAKLKEFMVEDDHRLFENDQSANSEVEEEVKETKKGKRRKKE